MEEFKDLIYSESPRNDQTKRKMKDLSGKLMAVLDDLDVRGLHLHDLDRL
jgi:hypothetical protein